MHHQTARSDYGTLLGNVLDVLLKIYFINN